jgi:hypothetical protein
MIFKKQLVTPDYAKKLLEANICNRRVKQPVFLQYANDMMNGRWKEGTAELIKISKTGVILDGQHRLLAVIKANVAIYFYIAFDLDDSVFDVLDTGSSRNATDVFKVKGIKQENTIPSIITMYNLLVSGKKAGIQKNYKSTNAVLLEQYFEDENFWQNIARKSHALYLSFAKILPPSYIGGFYAFFNRLNEEKAEEFMNQLATGISISNDVIMLLRNKLMQDRMALRKMPPTVKIALIIKTWNCFVKNETVKILKYDPIRDDFPVANNYKDIKIKF